MMSVIVSAAVCALVMFFMCSAHSHCLGLLSTEAHTPCSADAMLVYTRHCSTGLYQQTLAHITKAALLMMQAHMHTDLHEVKQSFKMTETFTGSQCHILSD